MIGEFLIGTDYEYFVKNEEGEIASAIGYIGGSKKQPLSIGQGCFRQSDNILAEFNQPPTADINEWLDYFRFTKEKGSEILNPQGLELYVSTSEYIDPKFLQHPIARTFGCEVSYSAYEYKPELDLNPTSNNLRTAGLHVHIGFLDDLESKDDYERLMRIMDYNLGVPSIVIDPDRVRRQRYGIAGEYRFAVRGEYNVIEYRSLGSYFLGSEELLKFVFEQTVKSVKDFNEGFNPDYNIQFVINNYNYDKAVEIIMKDEALSQNELLINCIENSKSFVCQ